MTPLLNNHIKNSLFCVLIYLASISTSFADEVRPAYLEIKENTSNLYSVLWKVPAKGDKKLSLQPLFHNDCVDKTQAITQQVNASYIQRWMIHPI